MPVYLLVTIVIGVFLVSAAAFLLILALMRVAEMRAALVEAGRRIQALEETVSSLQKGVLVAQPVTEPKPLPEPIIVAIPAPQTPALGPALERPATAQKAAQEAPRAARTEERNQDEKTSKTPPAPRVPAFAMPRLDLGWAPSAGTILAALVLIAAANAAIPPTLGFIVTFTIGAVIALAGFLTRGPKEDYAPALGFATMAAALIVAVGPLGLGPSPLAYLGLAALTVIAAGAGPWGGTPLALGGIVVGLAAPLLIQLGDQGGAARYGHLLALCAAALGAAATSPSLRGWALLAVGGALGWGVVGAIQGQDSVAIYLAGLGALSLGLWWPEAAGPITWNRLFERVQLAAEPSKIGIAVLLASLAFLLITQARAAPELAALSALALVALAALATAMIASRPGFALPAAMAIAAGLIAILLWPVDAQYPLVGLSVANSALATAALLAAVSSAGGWLSLSRPDPTPEAVGFAGVAPLAILGAAAVRLRGGEAELIGAGALFIALSCAVLSYALAPRVPDNPNRKPSAAALAVGAAAGAFALASAVPATWLTMGLAALVPAFIWIDRRREGTGLVMAAMIIALVVLYRLATPWTSASTRLSETPIFNELTLIYGASGLALAAGAWLLAPANWHRAKLAAEALRAGAWMTIALWASVQVRHGFGAGDVNAPISTLTEIGLHACIWLALALAISVGLIAPRTKVLNALETLAVGVAAAISLVGAGLLANPWWGIWPAAAPQTPILNALIVAFAAPAFGLAAWALIPHPQARPWATRLALAGAGMLAFVHVTLELRRGFAGAAMAQAQAGTVEQLAYTLVGIVFSAGLLAVGVERQSRALQVSSLLIALIAVAKFAIVDLTAVDMALRLISTIVAIVVAAALVWFYQTHVFTASNQLNRQSAERDPAPPS
ncbi:MAG: DUF2339 domain-containing protein [Caulobacterales bacterium]